MVSRRYVFEYFNYNFETHSQPKYGFIPQLKLNSNDINFYFIHWNNLLPSFLFNQKKIIDVVEPL